MDGRRMIHTSIWKSKQVCSLTDKAKILFIGLISIADDAGRFNGDSALLKADLFPRDRIGVKRITKLLKEVELKQLIVLYTANNESFGYHPNWNKYQTLRSDRLKQSNIPPPPTTNRQPSVNQVTAEDKVSQVKIRKENTVSVLHTRDEHSPRSIMSKAREQHGSSLNKDFMANFDFPS